MIWLLLILSLLVPAQSWAAVVATGTPTTIEALTLPSGNASIPADADAVFICVAERDTNSSGITPDTGSFTVGGAAATQLTGVSSDSGGALAVRSVIFYKLAPATGTVAIAGTADTGTDRIVIAVLPYKGVAQSLTFNTPGGTSAASGTNVDVDGLASAVGEVAILCGTVSGSSTTVAPDATVPVSSEIIEAAHTNATSVRVFAYEEAGASSAIDMRVDLSGSSRHAAAAVSIRAAAVATVPFGPLNRRR